MRPQRYATLASFLLLGACAHAPGPVDPSPRERVTRVQPLETDSAALQHIPEKAAAPAALAAPAGIDLASFELPVQYNEQVQGYIDLYAHRRRGAFATWLRRMGRYREHIEEQLRSFGLPRELVYLPLIESGYEANVASRASAVGLWQFMKGTARAEGLEVSEYVDERRDPMRSTEAALRHLQGLYDDFGSWYLAAAAYNSGSGRIARLLKEHGYAKGEDDAFWALQDALPRETRDYVPMLLAATIVGEHAEHFGIIVAAEQPVRFDLVTVPGATELRAIARAVGTTLDEIKDLNAHFIKGITPPDQPSEVRVPAGRGEAFAEAFARIPDAERTRALTSTHVVKAGETLSGIARRYGTTVEAISRVNRIERPGSIATGRKLLIPAGT